ncbi:hypothetical protein [Pseudactinotalea suaedae]|uniref:hypothetical protein n=1 Tax=Pseudactinotalea suaedae TaxID=1524924 RepID=UPI001391BA6B|nr:hypothetical protein [Pseudactinotalea suaedae]
MAGTAGESMGDKYAVDNESAGKVATDTETAVGDLDDVTTSITDPLTDAEGGLPPEFAGALARLKTLRENHERDVKAIKTYATGCVGALRACLTVYESSSAEMVAEQKATEAKVSFEHGSILGITEQGWNEAANEHATAVNDRLPNNSPNDTRGKGFEYASNSTGTTTTRSSASSEGGVTTTTSDRTAHGSNGRTEVSTTTTQTTSSMRERLTYETYSGSGHRTSDGSGQTSASGETTTYQSGFGRPSVETTGRTDLPVAP